MFRCFEGFDIINLDLRRPQALGLLDLIPIEYLNGEVGSYARWLKKMLLMVTCLEVRGAYY